MTGLAGSSPRQRCPCKAAGMYLVIKFHGNNHHRHRPRCTAPALHGRSSTPTIALCVLRLVSAAAMGRHISAHRQVAAKRRDSGYPIVALATTGPIRVEIAPAPATWAFGEGRRLTKNDVYDESVAVNDAS